MKSILSHRGYSVNKEAAGAKNLSEWKRELTLVPFSEREEFAHLAKPIELYQESDVRFYTPRYWGVKNWGPPDTDKITNKTFEHRPNLKFKGKPRPAQLPVIDAATKGMDTVGGGIISIGCAGGKCLAVDTGVLLYSGEIKKVQDVKVGDQLMGDDSTPRNVLSLARGREMMYDIVPNKGDTYTVNESHILTLKCSVKCKYGNKGDLVDMSLKDYINLPPSYHERAGKLLGCRTGVEFPVKEVPLDPYFVGVWLGDGNSRQPMITTVDKEILDYVTELAESHCHSVVQVKDDPITYRIKNSKNVNSNHKHQNFFAAELRKLNLFQNKHIPDIYKCNSRDIRMKVLAGILDTDGSEHHGCYDIVQKSKKLMEDIVYLARSLGFSAYMKECKKTCTNAKGGPKTGTYYRTNINGPGLELLPLLLERKRAQPRKQIKDVLATRIKVVKKKEDNYYGFTIDGNHRFLLGDFTITHNTVIAIYLACQQKIPTAVICHTTGMMMQWVERIREFCPTARIGIVQQNKCELEDKDFIIMSVKTIALKNYPTHHFNRIGLVIWDEIHLMCTNLFSNAFPKLATKHGLGLSATPFRKDKCDAVFSHHIGPILYSKKRDADTTVEAHCISLQLDGIESVYNKFGKIMYTSMAVAITKREDRTAYLAGLIGGLGSQGRCVLVLSEYINHLKSLMKAINARNFHRTDSQQQYAFMSAWHPRLGKDSPLRVLPKDVGKLISSKITRPVTCGLYIGEMKNKDRKVSESKDILLGSYKMASVGMDIPTLNSLVFASPRKDIEQSVGRILRARQVFNPVIYDIIDNHGVFKAQSKARKDFYRQYKYTIVHSQQLADGTVLSTRRVKAKNRNGEEPEEPEENSACMFLPE